MRGFLPVLTALLAPPAAAKFYKREAMAASAWEGMVDRDLDYLNSTIECGSVCDVLATPPKCYAFKFSPGAPRSSCQLVSKSVYCAALTADPSLGATTDYHLTPFLPTVELEANDEATVFAPEPSRLAIAVSSIAPGEPDPRSAIDGNFGDPTFASREGTTIHRWIEIRLPARFYVKGASLRTPRLYHRLETTEVRVGSTQTLSDGDTDTISQDEMLCQNQLCFQNGHDYVSGQEYDCITPLAGDRVTVQRYAGKGVEGPIIYMSEVGVTVYCGPFARAGRPCVQEPIDMCQNRADLVTEAFGPADASDRATWTATASSAAINAPDVLIDGVLLGQPGAAHFATETVAAGGPEYSWVQVDTGAPRVVKGVDLHSLGDNTYRQSKYNEVRVGDVDATVEAVPGERFCFNGVCWMTNGGHGIDVNSQDCSGGPLAGRFVTVQRHDYVKSEPQYSNIALTEIVIIFYT